MALDISGHAINDVSHGYTRVGVIRIVVEDRGRVNGAIASKWPETLVPMNVAKLCQKKS